MAIRFNTEQWAIELNELRPLDAEEVRIIRGVVDVRPSTPRVLTDAQAAAEACGVPLGGIAAMGLYRTGVTREPVDWGSEPNDDDDEAVYGDVAPATRRDRKDP